MKILFGIFALFFVATNAAAIQDPVNYEGLVNDVVNELQQIAINSAQALSHQVESTVLEPLQQVEVVMQSIEERKIDNEECVVAQEQNIQFAVDAMHDDMNSCGIVAAKTSASIMNDINKATQQLVFDGFDILKTYNKCRNYKNIVLKNSCYARLSIKATLYLKNARRSIKIIKKSTNERIPAVFVDANTCTHSASDKAVSGLNAVHEQIDICAGGN